MTTVPSGTTSPLYSPLHDRHVALGAKMADFGGWDMPIEYPVSYTHLTLPTICSV